MNDHVYFHAECDDTIRELTKLLVESRQRETEALDSCVTWLQDESRKLQQRSRDLRKEERHDLADDRERLGDFLYRKADEMRAAIGTAKPSHDAIPTA